MESRTKNNEQGNQEVKSSQEGGQKHKSPFKETLKDNEEANPQEEAALEQERKEALTERD